MKEYFDQNVETVAGKIFVMQLLAVQIDLHVQCLSELCLSEQNGWHCTKC